MRSTIPLLLLMTAGCAAAANPVLTMTASLNPIASGSTTLTWTSTCPPADCASITIDNSIGTVAASGSQSVSPAHTTTYTLRVQSTSLGQFDAQVTVFVGAGNLSITQSVVPANGGNGCGENAVIAATPGYPCELTFTYAGAGCGSYVPGSVACGGGTVSNPWEDVSIKAVFTGETSATVYTIWGFYEGGANSGNGNQWKVRFQPSTAEVWDSVVTFSSPSDYKVISTTGLFKSTSSGPGFIGLYGAGNNYLLKTVTDSKVFYAQMVNASPNADLGNYSIGGVAAAASIGFSPNPSSGFQSSIPNTRNALAQLSGVGFNMMRQLTIPILTSLGNFANVYAAGNAGITLPRGAITADVAFLATLQSGMRNWCVMIQSPSSFITSLNVFTSADTTENYLHAWQFFINRYGAYCDVWDMGNEQTGTTTFINTVGSWIHQQDPYGHLTSYTNQPASKVDGLDIPQGHLYTSNTVNPTLGLAGTVTTNVTSAHAVFTNQPYVLGEVGGVASQASDIPANEQLRQWLNTAFFNQAAAAPWPDYPCNGLPSNNICLGTQLYPQVALFSAFTSSIDPTASSLSIVLTGGTGSQTLVGYALASGTDLAGWILNTTNRVTVHNATVQFTVPAASMAGEWIAPSTGVVLSTFTTSVTPGSQTFTIPDFSSTVQTGDIWFRIRSVATPVVTTVAAPACLISTSCPLTLSSAGGSGGNTWAITAGALPPGLSLNTATGAITGTVTTAGNWNFYVAVTDNTAHVSASQKLILVVIQAIAIGNTHLDNFINGTAASSFHTPVVVTGGLPPVTCAITGTPPTGLSGNTSCGLSGTPTTPGTYTFTATATDAASNTAAATISATVPASTVAIQQANNPNATVNWPFNWQSISAKGGAGGYTWAVTTGSLPTGLTLSVAAGVARITGTPTVIGSTTFSLTATDSGSSASDPVSYTVVVSAQPTITDRVLPAYTSNIQYEYVLTVSGGTLPLSCYLAQGLLPPGFYLDAGSCVIYGTSISRSNWPVRVNVVDANGAFAGASFQLAALGADYIIH